MQELEKFLFYELPSFSREAYSAYKPGLERMQKLMKLLGQPQSRFESIHIAGTNGKGSVCNILADSLQQNGQKTGKYTSPHLVNYRERIQIDGMWMPEQYALDFTNRYFGDIQKIKPSFFELTVAMAFQYFAEQEVDVAVIEVGMGGELDSTNVLLPLLSIITNIGLDHQYALGDTLPEVAGAKAGIIKPKRPVIIGETQEQTSAVFRNTAAERSAEIRWADQEYRLISDLLEGEQRLLQYAHGDEVVRVKTDLRGSYQAKNIATTLLAAEWLESSFPGWPSDLILSLQDFQRRTDFSGRWQILDESPQTILEVSHNLSGVHESVKSLAGENYQDLYIVLGLSSDKDYAEILEVLPAEAHYIMTAADSRRAQKAKLLMEEAKKQGKRAEIVEGAGNAIRHASELASEGDLILILGSLYLAGEILPLYA